MNGGIDVFERFDRDSGRDVSTATRQRLNGHGIA
jgi:hypothetical protein